MSDQCPWSRRRNPTHSCFCLTQHHRVRWAENIPNHQPPVYRPQHQQHSAASSANTAHTADSTATTAICVCHGTYVPRPARHPVQAGRHRGHGARAGMRRDSGFCPVFGQESVEPAAERGGPAGQRLEQERDGTGRDGGLGWDEMRKGMGWDWMRQGREGTRRAARGRGQTLNTSVLCIAAVLRQILVTADISTRPL